MAAILPLPQCVKHALPTGKSLLKSIGIFHVRCTKTTDKQQILLTEVKIWKINSKSNIIDKQVPYSMGMEHFSMKCIK